MIEIDSHWDDMAMDRPKHYKEMENLLNSDWLSMHKNYVHS